MIISACRILRIFFLTLKNFIEIKFSREYAALIFDCDGTLADSMPVHYRSWVKTLGAYGHDFSEQQFYALGGVPTEEIVHILNFERGTHLDAVRVARQKDQLFHDMEGEVRPRTSVVAVVKKYHRIKPMAVGSGSTRWSVEKSIAQLGLTGCFDALVCREDVEKPKPDPEVFLRGAEIMRVQPGQCIVFEDTELGTQAARSAGMDVLDVRGYA